jgi:hypothetical protein
MQLLFKTNKMATLNLKFSTEYSFEKAKKHFQEVSNFTPSEINEEFKSIDFEVSDSDDADNTESFIESELTKTAYIQNYHFEHED